MLLSGRSLMNIKKRTGPKTDPCGAPDKSGTRSEAWPSNTIFDSAQRAMKRSTCE